MDIKSINVGVSSYSNEPIKTNKEGLAESKSKPMPDSGQKDIAKFRFDQASQSKKNDDIKEDIVRDDIVPDDIVPDDIVLDDLILDDVHVNIYNDEQGGNQHQGDGQQSHEDSENDSQNPEMTANMHDASDSEAQELEFNEGYLGCGEQDSDSSRVYNDFGAPWITVSNNSTRMNHDSEPLKKKKNNNYSKNKNKIKNKMIFIVIVSVLIFICLQKA